jgi:rRNA-processing protein FCF1
MIPTWRQRLAEMDHSKGTSNIMIQSCMKKEIRALREALRKQTAKANRNKESSMKWRLVANRYQSLLAQR